MLQYRSVYPETLELLKLLMQHQSLKDSYLVGGTALALYLGHRVSVDLDLFSSHDFDVQDIVDELQNYLDFTIVQQKLKNSLIINARKKGTNNKFVKVDVLKYPYKLINDVVKFDQIRLLSVEDIIAMKLSAIANRGAKKDFFDIFELLKVYSLEQMLEFFSQKFPFTEHFQILKSLTFFEDAEDEFDPISLNNTKWGEVKTKITIKVNNYL